MSYEKGNKIMSEKSLETLRDEALLTLDCGDNGCCFKRKNEYGVYGMRTNGGCRCLLSPSRKQRAAIRELLLWPRDNK